MSLEKWEDRAAISIAEAATVLGIGKSVAYREAREGTFPVEVIRIGGRYVVPVAPLRRLLGIGEVA